MIYRYATLDDAIAAAVVIDEHYAASKGRAPAPRCESGRHADPEIFRHLPVDAEGNALLLSDPTWESRAVGTRAFPAGSPEAVASIDDNGTCSCKSAESPDALCLGRAECTIAVEQIGGVFFIPDHPVTDSAKQTEAADLFPAISDFSPAEKTLMVADREARKVAWAGESKIATGKVSKK